MVYPRLELAVVDHHMEFVTHDYTQQILRTCWLRSDLTGMNIHLRGFYDFNLCVLYALILSLTAVPAVY
jgi:hypothetical protein